MNSWPRSPSWSRPSTAAIWSGSISSRAAEQARQTINAWVEKQTNGKIKDLISPGVLDATTRLVLTNAVYFKGNWATQFKKELTRDQPFTLLDGSKVQVPMMNQKETVRLRRDRWTPGARNALCGPGTLDGHPPAQRRGRPGAMEKSLTAQNLSKWLAGIHRQEVIVTVPRFKMTQKFAMKAVLESMGMTEAFSSQADFSGMTGRRDLFLSAVIHQAYVDVNEEGTEAAAATAGTMKSDLDRAGPDPCLPGGSSLHLPDPRHQLRQHPLPGPHGKSQSVTV